MIPYKVKRRKYPWEIVDRLEGLLNDSLPELINIMVGWSPGYPISKNDYELDGESNYVGSFDELFRIMIEEPEMIDIDFIMKNEEKCYTENEVQFIKAAYDKINELRK